MRLKHIFLEDYRTFLTGFIGTLGVFIVLELSARPLLVATALVSMVVAVYLAKQSSEHFHHGHHHALGDSALDVIAPVILILANILHPAADGFSFFETMRISAVGGVLYAVGIILHEFVRQSFLIDNLKEKGIRWYWVVGTALFGIGAGIGLAALKIGWIESHEYVADIATLFAYAFVIGEQYFHVRHGKKSRHALWMLVGIIAALLLSHYLQMH